MEAGPEIIGRFFADVVTVVSANGICYKLTRRRGVSMLKTRWSGLIVVAGAAFLVLAVGYGQVCGLDCVLGSCLELSRHDHSGEHSEHSNPSRQSPNPSNSNCAGHGHTSNFIQTANQSSLAVKLSGTVFFSLPQTIVVERAVVLGRWFLYVSHSPPNLGVHHPLYLSLLSLRI